MTTAMNIETVKGRSQGLPYMESIALRGLIPLHVPHKVDYCSELRTCSFFQSFHCMSGPDRTHCTVKMSLQILQY